MRPGKQPATPADELDDEELDETTPARRDSSLDNLEHSSSLSRQTMTPQYPDALMRSHGSSKQAATLGTSVMRADLEDSLA